MTTEDRLRAALRDEAASVEVREPGWDAVESRGSGAVRARRRRLTATVVLSAAAAVALIAGLVAVVHDDSKPQQVHTIGEPPAVTPTSTGPTSASIVGQVRLPFWDRTFPDPKSAGRAFAHDYIGMTAPVVADGSTPGKVLVRAKSGRGPFTAIETEHDAGGWHVTGAHSDNLLVKTPTPDMAVASPVTLTGGSLAFEAHVNVEVRDFGQTTGQSLASTFFTGGGSGPTIASFNTTVAFSAPSRSTGAVMLFTRSAEDGAIAEATVVPVRFS